MMYLICFLSYEIISKKFCSSFLTFQYNKMVTQIQPLYKEHYHLITLICKKL